MISERVVEQYRFSCARCGSSTVDSYQALLITDSEGNVRSFYSRGGFPCEAPAAAETLCPSCHRGPVHVTLAQQTILTTK
ncbi:hypothetical protein [Kutzneria kofuensis]|uniref:Uncharacterized protein n=1 Tax=Kutzneria kofuensis TaxID=103725 RepID=A0A7W9NMX7_9PSEU|nr:hypothetical protein [Kutzneria kofuensis]MBB5897996.1 hypothetical protein [Kutzneria kofuensis]